MEEKLQQVQDYFADADFEDVIDKILEEYLDKSKCEFTPYQKNVFPICAAYYAIIEAREKLSEEETKRKQVIPTSPEQSEKQQNNNGESNNMNIENNNDKKQNESHTSTTSNSSSSCASPTDDKNNKNNSKNNKDKDNNNSRNKKKITNVSIMELRNQFYKKVAVDQLLKTITEFSQALQGRPYSEIITGKLESIKRNYSLFTKFLNVLDSYYNDSEIILKQITQRVIWRIYILLKEQLHKDHQEEDIEKCAYLLHFLCTEALIASGKNPSSLHIISPHQTTTQAVLPNTSQNMGIHSIASLQSISEQVNAILLKSKLESSKMKEFQPFFTSILNSLSSKIFDSYLSKKSSKKNKKNQEGNSENSKKDNNNQNKKKGGQIGNSETQQQQQSSASNNSNISDDQKIDEEKQNDTTITSAQNSETSSTSSNQIILSFSSFESLEKLSKLLQKEINTHNIIEEHEFLQKEEDFKKSLTTPLTKPISSMLLDQNAPGVTSQESKYLNIHHNQNSSLIPKKTLNFNDDNIVGLNLNSKLSDLDKPMHSPLYNNNMMGQHNNNNHNEQYGLFQQPLTPKTPYDHFKMPHTRNPMIYNYAPNTPYHNQFDNWKWFNFYSKYDPTKRIDYLMNKIDKEYKQKILDEVSIIVREIFYHVKKKVESLTANSDNTIESRVAKASSFFQNVLEKMICDEESRNCRENVLIQLLDNRNFIFSLLANCVITMCHIKQIKGITLELVLKQCKITSVDFWRVISNFAKFDRQMPEDIREQLFNHEKHILLYNIWEEKDRLIQNALKTFAEENGRNQNYEKVICRRLISHSATRVKEICKVIDLNEEIQERVWEALLYVYRSQIQLMNGRYVDQIIICTIYALKLIKSDLFKEKEIKFKGMINSCESLLHFNSEKVKKTLNDNGEQIDIINFYNKIFLNPMKQYFKSTNNINTNNLNPDGTQSTASSAISISFNPSNPNTSILNSSLKNSIPSNFINYTPLLKEELQNHNRITMTPMTPMTQHLQASENLESPYPINPNLKFIKEKIALTNINRLQQQQLQQQQQAQNLNNNSGNTNSSDKSDNNNSNNRKTVAILGSSFSASSIQNNINNNSIERKSTRKLNFEGDDKKEQNFFGNTNNNGVSTPTLEQKDSSPAGVSPKFGCGNSASSFGLSQNKKFQEDNIEEQNITPNQQQQQQQQSSSNNNNNNNNQNQILLKRQNSIFGVRNPNFNSDDENETNNNNKTNKICSNE